MNDSLYLSLFFLVPLAGSLLIWLLPANRPNWSRTVALVASGIPLAQGLWSFIQVIQTEGAGFVQRVALPLAPSWGVHWHLGVDGLAASMLFLSGLIGVIAVIASWGIEKQVRAYMSLLLLLFAGVNGVFVALDFFLFYTFWELMLIPMFFLIAIWGGEQRRYASMKFFLYTMAGSVLLLIVMFALYFKVPAEGVAIDVRPGEVAEQGLVGQDGIVRLYDLPVMVRGVSGWLPASGENLEQLRNEAKAQSKPGADIQQASDEALLAVQVPRSLNLLHHKLLWRYWEGQKLFGLNLALVCFAFLFIAFAVKVPAIPFHTWLPHAHVQAPTAVSVVLAGVLLKLGVYGFMRLSWPIFPIAATQWSWAIGALGVASILYAAICALGQSDLKRLVAYSSVSHMGFCLLGLASITVAGVSGSLFQMFSHGLGAAMLFLLVGVLYDRAHHRRVDGFGGLATPMPMFSGIFLLACFSAAGLPGLAGFPGELSSLLGAAQSKAGALSGHGPGAFRWLAILAATSVILSAAYLLWTIKRVSFGPIRDAAHAAYADLTLREKITLYPLAALTILFGIWPAPLQAVVGPAAGSLVRHLSWAAGIH